MSTADSILADREAPHHDLHRREKKAQKDER